MDKKIIDKFKTYVAISNFEEEYGNQNNTLEDKSIWRNICIMKKKIISVICAILILLSGVAFATNIDTIKEFFNSRGLGKGIDSAIEQGYIEDPKMDYKESDVTVEKEAEIILDNIKIDVKIDDFMMDDLNLSTQFNIKFDDKINDYIDIDNLHNIKLEDLIVTDEENRIIFCGAEKEDFEKYCKENGLNFIFGETNENYMNCGLNYFPTYHDKENNYVKLNYNMYTDEFPKSKKLYFSFEKILLTENEGQDGSKKEVLLKGNWKIDVDVPEKMYNRTEEYYKVVSCDKDNLDIYTAKVTDTGFEIGITVSNVSRVKTKFDELSNWDNITEKDYVEETNKNYVISNDRFIYIDTDEVQGITTEEIGCVINENGEKFECTLSPSRKQNANFIDGNKFDFYETYGMTKKDATDKIKVVLLYYGEPFTIELEKISND